MVHINGFSDAALLYICSEKHVKFKRNYFLGCWMLWKSTQSLP